MKLKAYAKINFSLRVFNKREDGYHDIESVMQSISLFDEVIILPAPSGIQVVCDDPRVPQGKGNLAYRAAELFPRKTTSGIKIEIVKHIPIAAGLAGGSADAAAVLFGLRQMTNDKFQISNDDLMKIGAQIGSDIPFCLTGGTCLVKGRGEIVEKQEPWPRSWFVLVCPDIQVSSKWAYEEFDNLHLNLQAEIKNDLEPAVAAKYEAISDIKEKLSALGCSEAQMSGSGSSVFGAVKNKAEGKTILDKIKDEYPKSYLVETRDGGIEEIKGQF